VAASGGKLVVNAEEARQVQDIFALYLQRRSLKTVLAETQALQWTTKSWRTRGGKEHVGRPFTKSVLERLLRNVLYLGQVSHQGKVYAGEHEAIIEQAVWERAKTRLATEQDEAVKAVRSSSPPMKMASRPPTAIPKRTERVPRVTRLLALALRFEELIQTGAASNYAVLAKLGQVSRARVTQMTSLLNLAPDIQEEILFLRVDEAEQLGISEPSLRRLTATLLWNKQREQWRSMHWPAPERGDGRSGHIGESALTVVASNDRDDKSSPPK
jgi:hypothetical protein